jgi:hypothetical protein
VSLALAGAARSEESTAPHASDWEASFGRYWKADVAIMAVVVFLFGAIRPLGDPDLPMHLAVGEWIARHHSVPFTEPFSWTAKGEPYFAYSWLLQLAYFETFATFGHYGLRAFQGVMVLSSGASAVLLARSSGWRPSHAVLLAGFNLIVAAFFVAMLRPQAILLITMPIIWAMFTRIARGNGTPWTVAWLFLASALTANAHLFFPVTLAPAILLWVHRRMHSSAAAAGVGAVIAGWMVSPYSLYWLSVFRHNFAPHVLISYPSPITELQPGFAVMVQPPLGPMLLLVSCMLAVPWILGQSRRSNREVIFAACYWMIGATAFGYAVRLFVLWWVLCIVPFGWALVHLTDRTEDAPPRLQIRLLGLVACLTIICAELYRTRDMRALEGSTRDRVLPTFAARPTERIAKWLQANTAPGAHGRIMTSFAFGSYLTWRLPGYSTSIDSRGLQPDSVAIAEAVVSAAARDVPLGPWRSADLAILPVWFRAAAALDTATGWRRALVVPGDPVRGDSTALWVRQDWWSSVQAP